MQGRLRVVAALATGAVLIVSSIAIFGRVPWWVMLGLVLVPLAFAVGYNIERTEQRNDEALEVSETAKDKASH